MLTPDKLLLYSAELNLLHQLDLPIERDASKDQWDAVVSPERKYLLLTYDPVKNEKRFEGLSLSEFDHDAWKDFETGVECVDLGQLKLINAWSTTVRNSHGFGPPDAISDEGTVQVWKLAEHPPGEVTAVHSYIVNVGAPPNGPWHSMCTGADSFCGPGKFVNNQTVLRTDVELPDNRSALWVALLSTGGALLFQQKFSTGEVLFTGTATGVNTHQTGIAIASGGQRFALAIAKIRGQNLFFDIGGHLVFDRVLIYDIPSRRWVYTLDSKKDKIKSIDSLAFSSDGTLLSVIDQDGFLDVYAVQ
ncbi:MAG: hypothetical protein ACRD4Y_04455 [Candidatus Acidiferrales bacterium]